MAEVTRGEIWMFSFPKPDKKRPVLILTRQDMIGRLHTVTVAPITSTIRGVPSEVAVGTESGLKQASAINLHHLATVPVAGLRTFVGALPSQAMTRVRGALLFSLGFVGPEASDR
jgi:mRNA interferase MazF